nr:DNA gyrase subunit A [Actinomycetales bacterium]
LAALERKKIQDEYKEKLRLIKYLEDLLKSPRKIRAVVRDELLQVKERYADPRRTQVVDGSRKELTATDLIPDEPVWVAVTQGGRVARTPNEGAAPRVPSRPQDVPVALVAASTRQSLYLFTSSGAAVAYPIHQLPEGTAWEGEGAHVADLTALGRQDRVVAALAPPRAQEAEGFLFLTTRGGVVKRIALSDLPGVSTEAFTVMGLNGDELGWVAVTSGEQEVVLFSAGGQAIRFKEDEVRPMGLAAGGVMGMKLKDDGDRVTGFAVVRSRSDLLTVASDGKAKRSPLSEYPTQGRHGQGVIAAKLGGPNVILAGGGVVQAGDPIILVTVKGGAKAISARNAPRAGRTTVGEEIISLRPGDAVGGVLTPRAQEEKEE